MSAHRLKSATSGRVPYSLVAIVVLASMLLLGSYLSVVSVYQTSETSSDSPELTQQAVDQAEAEIEQAAHFDLMNATAQILASSQYGSGGSAPLDLLNASVNTLFKSSLISLGLNGAGLTIGTVTVNAVGWGINVTYAQGQVEDTVSSISLQSEPYNPGFPLASAVNTELPNALSATQDNVYPMTVGYVNLVANNAAGGSGESVTYSFTTTLQSEVGLLESQAAQFSDASYGSDGSFSRLVTYLSTTLGELRALAGYGSGGYPGPHADTTVSADTAPSVLTLSDFSDALNLSILLESLQYFRSFDSAAVGSVISGIPAGAYQTLLERYVYNGTIDTAALYLLLLNSSTTDGGSYGIGEIATGEGIAAAVDSFADRYKFDLLQQFWDTNVVDPTLTEPVVDWGLFDSQSDSYYENMLNQWISDYQNWLGITLTSIPQVSNTAVITPEYNVSGPCNYTILPEGSITVATNGVQSLEDLILGSVGGTITLNNGDTLNWAPDAFNLWENVTINCNADQGNPGPGGCWQDGLTGNPEQVGYYVVNESLLGEYNAAANATRDTLGEAERNTLTIILEDLSNAMDTKSTAVTDQNLKGLLDYMAYLADMDGNNYTLAQAGLPNLATLQGIATALNDTSYSLLANGSSAIFSGPFLWALENFTKQATNPAWQDSAWINGAAHPDLITSDTNSVGANPWTVTDVARMTSREWFQAIYNLYYATSGAISPWPVGEINGVPMDANQYDVVSNGVEHNPPPDYYQPDWAMNVQNETYISAMAWMGWQWPNGYECGFPNGNCGDTARFNGNFATGGGVCDTSSSPAYQAALAWWYGTVSYSTHTNEEGTGLPSHTWNHVKADVLQALGFGNTKGVDSIHPSVTTSFNNIVNNTGDAYWGCTTQNPTCPTDDQGNFTNWILKYIAPPILADINSMGETGGWLYQLYNSSLSWLENGTNVSGTIYKPTLDRDLPYSLWWGNSSGAAANEALFNESLSGMQLTTSAGTLSWVAPSTTVHLVDAQDDSSNMGIAPFVTTWEMSVYGSASIQLTSERASLARGGILYPTQLNLTVPLNFISNVTLYTPWPLEGTWDEQPLTVVMTRGYFGFEGNDYGTTAASLLPGVYISPELDNLIMETAPVSRIANSEGSGLADLLAGLPDKGVGGSASWAENLTILENTTNYDLSRTAGFETTLRNTMANILPVIDTFNAKLPLGRAPLPTTLTSNIAAASNAYFGSNLLVDLLAGQQCLAYFDTAQAPTSCGTAFVNYAPSLAYALDLSGQRAGVSYSVDNQYPHVAPNPMVHGFSGSWGDTNGSAHTVVAGWQEFNTPYELTLSGPSALTVYASTSLTNANLPVPYISPTAVEPATLSVFGTSALPPAASSAFTRSVNTWLPAVSNFNSYISEQLYAAGYLYDDLTGNAPDYVGAVTQFGYSTLLQLTALHEQNYSLYEMNKAGLFGNQVQVASSMLPFLAWFEANARALASDLGGSSADPTVLSSASPLVLSDTFRGVTYTEGMASSPFMDSYSSPNLAFTEADLGGASGGLTDAPVIDVGGWTPDWGISGALTID